MAKVRDLTNQQFERLKVIEMAEHPQFVSTRSTYWLCECKCGKRTVVASCSLVNGLTKSCGCLRREMARERMERLNESRADKVHG